MIRFNLPHREEKPRNKGLTMVIDTGSPYKLTEDYLEMSAPLIDYVKLGWGTSYVTNNLEKKLKLFKKYNIPVSLGGTFFELAYLQNKLPELKEHLLELDIQYLEISDGTVEFSLEKKVKLIKEFTNDFKVLSEVGSKDIKRVIKPKTWVEEVKATLDAGAWKVIAEGRESGKAGLYRDSSEIRTGLIDEIVDEVALEDLIFEAPLKSQQAWFIKEYGSNINLGNIHYDDIIGTETLRLGLRSDTLIDIQGNL